MSGLDWRTRAREFLDFFALMDRVDERVATYSKRIRQCLALGRALLHNPARLSLDEPTVGLDPEASQQVHGLIKSIRKRDCQTVMLCTYSPVEAQRFCDQLVILNRGLRLASGGLADYRGCIHQVSG
ncbi:MAG: hypothetical protein MUO76_09435 [Anaerolineaceae bacterium]|nr:hypothetical protein [Anaerolineaceae bacterium]